MNRNKNRKEDFKAQQTKNKVKIIIYMAALLFLILVYVFLTNIGQETPPAQNEMQGDNQVSTVFRKDGDLTFTNRQGDQLVTIDIELAQDPIAIRQGLMHRESMEENQGMLFIFQPVNRPDQISMWMRNTIIPLDMIFIRQNRTISQIVEHTVPFDETSIISDEPASYVLEVNAGFASRHGIEPGQQVSW